MTEPELVGDGTPELGRKTVRRTVWMYRLIVVSVAVLIARSLELGRSEAELL